MNEKPNKPSGGFTVGGFRPTGRVRLRTVFFGFSVLEELIEYRDGSSEWRRVQYGGEVNLAKAN